MKPKKIRHFMSLHYISMNNLKNADHRHILLTGTYYKSIIKKSKKIFTHLLFQEKYEARNCLPLRIGFSYLDKRNYNVVSKKK